MARLTAHAIQQARTVAELQRDGYTTHQIAETLGVSGPRVSQIRATLHGLADYLGDPTPTERLLSRRAQLRHLRADALRLALAIRRDLTELDEELQSARIDRLLGLRG